MCDTEIQFAWHTYAGSEDSVCLAVLSYGPIYTDVHKLDQYWSVYEFFAVSPSLLAWEIAYFCGKPHKWRVTPCVDDEICCVHAECYVTSFRNPDQPVWISVRGNGPFLASHWQTIVVCQWPSLKHLLFKITVESFQNPMWKCFLCTTQNPVTLRFLSGSSCGKSGNVVMLK